MFRRPFPSGAADPLVGSILVDDLIQLFDDKIAASSPAGALTRDCGRTEQSARGALGLPCGFHGTAVAPTGWILGIVAHDEYLTSWIAVL